MLGWFRLQIGRVLYVPYVLVDMRTNIPSKAPKTYKKNKKARKPSLSLLNSEPLHLLFLVLVSGLSSELLVARSGLCCS